MSLFMHDYVRFSVTTVFSVNVTKVNKQLFTTYAMCFFLRSENSHQSISICFGCHRQKLS